MYKIFDTHAHYNDAIYNADRDELFKRMYANGVTHITLIGANMEESIGEKKLAEKYKGVNDMPEFYYTIGYHPDDIPKFDPSSEDGVACLNKLEDLCKDEKGNITAVAIGEIGFDYHGDFKTEEDYKNQIKWFDAQIELAKKLKLPIVVHSRDACKDTIDMIKEKAKDLNGIIHCFSYEKETAIEYIKLGYYIGIGGTVTFKNGRKTKEVVDAIPVEYIVTETDAPWLSPTPHRGTRNESDYIKYVIEEITDIKKLDINDLADELYKNAFKVYNLKG